MRRNGAESERPPKHHKIHTQCTIDINDDRALAKHIPGPPPLAAVSLASQEFKFSAMEEIPRKAVASCRALSADF